MVMFFLILPDLSAIKQPEGVKKELTQSSLICTKGKASLFIESRKSVERIHCFVAFVL